MCGAEPRRPYGTAGNAGTATPPPGAIFIFSLRENGGAASISGRGGKACSVGRWPTCGGESRAQGSSGWRGDNVGHEGLVFPLLKDGLKETVHMLGPADAG